MNSLILAGGGGHCSSCIDVIESEGKYRIHGIVQPISENQESLLGYPVIGEDNDIPELISKGLHVLVTVGQLKSPDIRVKLYRYLKEIKAPMPIIISPNSHVSSHATLQEGTIVMHGAIVNAGTHVSENCIVNSQALLEHDVFVDSHTHISTGARVNGGVKIGKGCFIGSGAVIREGIEIGDGSVIGAGKAVFENVATGSVLRNLS